MIWEYRLIFKSSTKRLPLVKVKEGLLHTYTCGCCGEWFQSTEEQDPAHDLGFGTCPPCIDWSYDLVMGNFKEKNDERSDSD